jgi:anti-sigma-K factor RskA
MADMDRDTFLDLIPAYALGALDDDERAVFEARLAGDPEAQRLLADYRAVADALVLLTPAQPAPPGLTDDLRRRLAAQRPAPAPLPLPASARRPLPRRLLALAAVLAVVFGALWLLTGDREGETMPPAMMYDELAARPDAVRVALVSSQPFEDVYGELVAMPTGGYAVIKVDCLPDLEAGMGFQMWVTMADGTTSTVGYGLQADGETTYVPVTFSQPLAMYRSVSVSIEPQTGSERPAGPLVFVVPLA